MHISKPLLFSIVGIVIVLGIGALIISRSTLITPSSQTPRKTTSISPTTPSYTDWEYFKNGYGIKIPPHWKNTSDRGGTAVLEPGTQVGNITKLSVTVLSDQKAPTGQSFTTQTEFDTWYTQSADSASDATHKIRKMTNVAVDRGRAMVLASGDAATWSRIIWTRKDTFNIYITIHGTGTYTPEDARAIEYMTQSFRYEAPTDTHGK